MKKLVTMLLSATICLMGLTSALAVTKDTYFTVSEYEQLTGKKIEKFNEAPSLKVLVAAGELPPVEKRLPEEPLVLLPETTDKKIGKYGGILRTNSVSAAQGATRVELQCLIRAQHSYSVDVYSNIVQSYESAKGGREWIFHLRKGLKWSDGVPYTTDDVMFWYEDIALNKELTPVIPENIRQKSGEPAKCVKIDDYTFKFVYDEPYQLLENIECLMIFPACWPKHYMKQFHPKYQDKDKLDEMVKEAGFDSWIQLMGVKQSWVWQDADTDKPVLTPWVCVQSRPAKTLIFERNPYYFAIDTEGNQLPYLDEWRVNMVADSEVGRLRAVAGQEDFFVGSLEIYSLAKQAEKEEGKIKVARWAMSDINTADLEFNLTVEDPVLRKIFRDKRFRFAASYAINREMINQLLFYGLLEPQQCGWSKASPFYNERLNKTAIEHDLVKANSLLDEMGLDKRGADGYRLRPDGKRLELNIVGTNAWPFIDKVGEIMADNLKAVGLFTNLRVVDWGFWHEIRLANTCEVALVGCTWGTNEGSYWQANAVGVPYNRNFWAPLWMEWMMSFGEKGEKPIPEVLEAIEAYWKFNETLDPEERKREMKKITDIAADNLWTIGTLSPQGQLVIYNRKLQNIPTEFLAWFRGDWGRPMLWFYEK